MATFSTVCFYDYVFDIYKHVGRPGRNTLSSSCGCNSIYEVTLARTNWLIESFFKLHPDFNLMKQHHIWKCAQNFSTYDENQPLKIPTTDSIDALLVASGFSNLFPVMEVFSSIDDSKLQRSIKALKLILISEIMFCQEWQHLEFWSFESIGLAVALVQSCSRKSIGTQINSISLRLVTELINSKDLDYTDFVTKALTKSQDFIAILDFRFTKKMLERFFDDKIVVPLSEQDHEAAYSQIASRLISYAREVQKKKKGVFNSSFHVESAFEIICAENDR